MRRSGLLSRLWPARRRRVEALEREVVRLRSLVELAAEASSASLVRAAAASQAAREAELRAVCAEAALRSARDEVAGLRAEVAALREELVWAFAEGRLPAAEVVDLRDSAARTA